MAALAVVMVASPVPSMIAGRYAYTWSLLIFVAPIALVSYWFTLTPQKELRPVRKAFFITLFILVAMAFSLDLLFADNFFLFPDQDAILGWAVPSLDFFSIDFEHPIPLEEFAFYTSGFVMLLLLYIWGDESFFSRYNVRDYTRAARSAGAIVQLFWTPLVSAMGLLGLAWIYKTVETGGGFPAYLAFLLVLPFAASLTLYKVAASFINWRAFAFVLVVLLAVSLLWEVTLALPGGWWSYQKSAMMGLYIHQWSDLPIEAVLVWLLGAVTTVVTFEAVKVFLHHPERFAARRLFGPGRLRQAAEMLTRVKARE